ncbi:Wadjet anti-phage system protein JetD domain-containing protein [Chitinivorax sp. B]|uniref:DUF3322 domain-containing protein n=1 Tax=Chitinivorax sp. B TaxID=2502235 RepID=UPI0010F44898|nr:Wadjet anti-phage system protein JetD domain-containing protein [Chitinivorax sp. B]
MSWTQPADLCAQVQRWWDRGELLAALVTGEALYPRRLVLKTPNSADLSDHFEAVRNWIAALRTLTWCRIEWRQVSHRVLGSNAVPQTAWVDDLNAALGAIGRKQEAGQFTALLTLTRQHQPSLLPWLAKRPLRALELAEAWPCLLSIVGWLQAHPRPGIYLRQVDLPGVDSKFIETHRSVLSEWLDLALPSISVEAGCTGVAQFAARYGFRDKPARVRFRPLDDGLIMLPGATRPDITLDADSFAALDLPVRRVFITENEINFLAFPDMPGSLVIFGAGYGWDAHAGAKWLNRCTVHYWGDIDTHGFAILDQLRSRFAHVESLLMDGATLHAHQSAWGKEPNPVRHDLPRLTDQEKVIYDQLRDNDIQVDLRLEQEKVGFAWLQTALGKL